MLACGQRGLPAELHLGPHRYALERVFKHDFFAATTLYRRDGQLSEELQRLTQAGMTGTVRRGLAERPAQAQLLVEPTGISAERIVLKLGREGDVLGLPLAWLGRAICGHEAAILTQLRGIAGAPQILARYGTNGLIYGYIEGVSLDDKPPVGDAFFAELTELLEQIHQRRIAYVDMNKRGNILLDDQGHPHLIDFQISMHLPRAALLSEALTRWLLTLLQREDSYHLHKHFRRFRPDLMSEEQQQQSRRLSPWIAWHRRLTRPLTLLRRRILGMLYKGGQMVVDPDTQRSPENDPQRWLKDR